MKHRLLCVTAESVSNKPVTPKGLCYWCRQDKQWKSWPYFRDPDVVPSIKVALGKDTWFSVSETHESMKYINKYELLKPNYLMKAEMYFPYTVMCWDEYKKRYCYLDTDTSKYFVTTPVDTNLLQYLMHELSLHPSNDLIQKSNSPIEWFNNYVETVKRKTRINPVKFLKDFIFEVHPIQTEFVMLQLRTL